MVLEQSRVCLGKGIICVKMLEKIDLGFLNLFDSETIDTYFVFAKKKTYQFPFFLSRNDFIQ